MSSRDEGQYLLKFLIGGFPGLRWGEETKVIWLKQFYETEYGLAAKIVQQIIRNEKAPVVADFHRIKRDSQRQSDNRFTPQPQVEKMSSEQTRVVFSQLRDTLRNAHDYQHPDDCEICESNIG